MSSEKTASAPIHGHFFLLAQQLKKSISTKNRLIIFFGDLIHRGRESDQALETVS